MQYGYFSPKIFSKSKTTCTNYVGQFSRRYQTRNILAHSSQTTYHIQSIATAANQKLGFLMRNLKGCPNELKKLSYVSMVRSGLEYASTIWDPHQANHKQRLEGTQRKAARWISNDYKRQSSVTSMLSKLELESLEDGPCDARLVWLYKISKSSTRTSLYPWMILELREAPEPHEDCILRTNC